MQASHLFLGRKGERIACRFLMKQGFDILARRFRARRGEIDLVALEGSVLVFIEVKTRASREFGDPWEFVGWEKQQSLRQAGEEFIARHDFGKYAYRFDVVSIIAPGTQFRRSRFIGTLFSGCTHAKGQRAHPSGRCPSAGFCFSSTIPAMALASTKDVKNHPFVAAE